MVGLALASPPLPMLILLRLGFLSPDQAAAPFPWPFWPTILPPATSHQELFPG